MHWNRQRSYASGITLCVIAAVIVVAITAGPFGFSLLQEKPGRSAEAGNNADYRTGTIVFESDPDRCREIKFDNITGRLSDAGPCEKKVIGSDVGPMPTGTFNRLQSIRNSFVGNQQTEQDPATGE